MTYDDLKRFLTSEMRMSHIYQPVMIKSLIEAGGTLPARDIARVFVSFDGSQIDYYEEIIKRMPGPVLSRRGVVVRHGKEYCLTLPTHTLTNDQCAELIDICKRKIDEYIAARGDRIWQHRKLNDRLVPGSARYHVLKQAGFRCELCGIPAEERALEVDHIVPINRGGGNELENLQTLCYKCNAEKRDQDSTDFRNWKEIYAHREDNCIFCNPGDRVIDQNELAYFMWDAYPVSEGHALVIPKRHTLSFFELYVPEQKACFALLEAARDRVLGSHVGLLDFNVGFNDGPAAGQTVMHCHVHLIPRREGDVSDARGGIRGVIPGKSNYL